MIHQHSLQTSAAFDRIDDALRGKTDDDLNELIEDLEFLLYKAKDIQGITASIKDGSDYDPQQYCDIPPRF
jgi:endonuclease III